MLVSAVGIPKFRGQEALFGPDAGED
jgi:hypothetical protein